METWGETLRCRNTANLTITIGLCVVKQENLDLLCGYVYFNKTYLASVTAWSKALLLQWQYSVSCPAGNTVYHVLQATQCIMSCRQHSNTVYHVLQATKYIMSCRQHSVSCPAGNTVYHVHQETLVCHSCLTCKLYLQLKRYEDAERVYKELLLRNPENTLYYDKLQQAQQLSSTDDKLSMFTLYQELFPRAQAPRRLPLNFASGEQFTKLVDRYLRQGLHKGVPPLFVDLRSLYKDPEKVIIIQRLVLQYIDALKKVGRFSEKDAEKEPASALLWAYYYLAQHFDFLGDTDKALTYIDAA
ncbi:unnamed protein product, partial [Timema podura]|nr:unnamed protein product [Timema podura]